MLWPVGRLGRGEDVDPEVIYGADHRPPTPERPWVLVNMIASVDGAATDPSGRAGGLGGPADRRVFSAIRAVSDVVLAGASTVRTERYGPARTPAPLQEARRARGQAPRPRIAVVTRSLALDLQLPLFREATDEDRPIVITTTAGLDRARGTSGAARGLAAVAEIVVAGDDSVDWATALAALRTTARAGVVLLEGGPRPPGPQNPPRGARRTEGRGGTQGRHVGVTTGARASGRDVSRAELRPSPGGPPPDQCALGAVRLVSRVSSRSKSDSSSKPLYTEAKRTAPTASSSRRCSSTARPTRSLVTSAPLSCRISSSTAAASASTSPSPTGRALTAALTPAITLSRSNGSRTPDRLTTVRTTVSGRSKVVNR